MQYRVIGRSDFPMDMLRYDGSWPSDSASAEKLSLSIRSLTEMEQRAWIRRMRVITLSCNEVGARPTEGRWSSFGWSVVNENLFRGQSNEQVEAYFNQGRDQ